MIPALWAGGMGLDGETALVTGGAAGIGVRQGTSRPLVSCHGAAGIGDRVLTRMGVS